MPLEVILCASNLLVSNRHVVLGGRLLHTCWYIPLPPPAHLLSFEDPSQTSSRPPPADFDSLFEKPLQARPGMLRTADFEEHEENLEG